MKVVTTERIGEYGLDGFTLSAESQDQQRSFKLHQGEPEDMIFGRNLEGPKSLQDMIKLAYDAGKRGERLEFIEEKEE